ncbi:MAG: hypothetical protein MEQ07_07660 [Aquimonas sp.]|nr:hypothetical protein [Aquimonas sp.]
MALCKRCKENEASPGAVTWDGFLPMLLGLPLLRGDEYCKDCGGGISFMGLAATAAVLVVVFVVLVILW